MVSFAQVVLCLLFQFHKGTIRTVGPVVSAAGSILFQFHKGTIRTNHGVGEEKVIHQFQFHKGTIRTRGRASALAWLSNFNSIKVQLEPVNP